MDKNQREYYHEMSRRGRLIPIRGKQGVKALITYYVGDDDSKYLRNNPWTVLEDNPLKGETVYIDQLITDKEVGNSQYSWAVFGYLKEYFKYRFPQVKRMKWLRKGKLTVVELQKEVTNVHATNTK